ncbi:MAG: hypothetical protein QG556_205 [Pseudomonadota bacterium]|nr:hypothetical protein [Pseudomonadota bacterium]
MSYQIGSGWAIDIVTAYGLTIEGIRKALLLRSLNIPVIDKPEDFKIFLKQVNIGEKAIAIIDDALFHDHDGIHVFAIYYEKGRDHDVLICFDSMNQNIDISKSKILEYFQAPLLIMTPDRHRQQVQETTCHAYAIEDAMILSQSLQKRGCLPIPIPRISSLEACKIKFSGSFFSLFFSNQVSLPCEFHKFTFTEAFLSFDATMAKKELFEMIIINELNEAQENLEFILR